MIKKIIGVDKYDKEIFEKYISNISYNNKKSFLHETLWYRTQDDSNKEFSNKKYDFDVRRRVVHSLQNYVIEDGYLGIDDFYLYLMISLPLDEIEDYKKRLILSSKKGKWRNKFLGENIILNKEDFTILITVSRIKDFDELNNNFYPKNYRHLEIFVTNNKNSFKRTDDYNRIWDLNKKGIRSINKYENPTEIKNMNELLDYLPAQLEIGCGPSIEVGIPALDSLHEIYGVQNKYTQKFYLGKTDTFIEDFLEDMDKKFLEFSEIIVKILRAQVGNSQRYIKELYDMGVFKGKLISNNFDGILRRIGIEDRCIRVYDINNLYPEIAFEKDIKSLIVLGSHADRRKIQEKARKKGLKIIYINPEGYFENGSFRAKPVESLKNEDFIVRKTSNEALKQLIDAVKANRT